MTPITATAIALVEDTSIADIDLQVVIIEQLQAIVDQLIVNGMVLEEKLNKINIAKIKMLLVKRFRGKSLS